MRIKFLTRMRKKAAKRMFDLKLHDLTSNDTCIDCGANVGVFTYQMALTGAQVFAFEPEPYAFSQLQNKVIGFSNVTLINAAVSDRVGTALFYKTPNFDSDPLKCSVSSSLIAEKINVSAENAIQVQVIDFLDFCKTLNTPIKLLKMDIEGSEVDILEKIIKDESLLSQIETMFVETHERKIPGTKDRVQAIRKFFSKRKSPYVNLNWR